MYSTRVGCGGAVAGSSTLTAMVPRHVSAELCIGERASLVGAPVVLESKFYYQKGIVTFELFLKNEILVVV